VQSYATKISIFETKFHKTKIKILVQLRIKIQIQYRFLCNVVNSFNAVNYLYYCQGRTEGTVSSFVVRMGGMYSY
jgi:hypothetical protein